MARANTEVLLGSERRDAVVVSFGTREWLRELVTAGWEASAVSLRRPGRRLRLLVADDLDTVWQEMPERVEFGVLCVSDDSQVFVRCASEAAARELLMEILGE